ncbi:MAG: HNH endonuclease, partial [Nocardioides sp.]|nr:HNH endonuclease [Nocardioides sp.]
MPATATIDPDAVSAAGLLAALSDAKYVENDAAARALETAVAWAEMHPASSIEDAATVWEGRYGDTGIPVAGPGAPLIAEFSVVEFAAALGVPTEVGKQFLGHAVELAHRLPRVWARVVARDLPAWRARRVAHATTHLSPEAAAFVDRHIGPVAHKTGPAQLDRLIDEAIAR